jgi:integrase
MAVRFRSDRQRWQASVGCGADRVSRSFETEPEAVAWEAAMLADQGKAKSRQPREPLTTETGTLGALLAICEGLDWAGKEQSQLENAHRLVLRLGPGLHPAEIDAAAIDAFVLSSKGAGLSTSTIKHYLSALGIMLKRAQRLGMIHTLPLFPENRTLKRAEPRNLVLPIEWFTVMVDHMERKEQRQSVALSWFLWHMGCRVGEALALTWDRIDESNNRINFVKTKGNLPRSLPIPKEVLPILRIMKARESGNVFPMHYNTFKTHYDEAIDAVCDKLNLSDQVRKDWVVHTLRHTCLTRLAQDGWPAPALGQWAGHASLSVTQRYVHGSAINLEAFMHC